MVAMVMVFMMVMVVIVVVVNMVDRTGLDRTGPPKYLKNYRPKGLKI